MRLRSALLIGVAAAACGDAARPKIGIATNLVFADAAALAVADAEAEWGELPADTAIVMEAGTRAAVAIGTATALAEIDGLIAVVGHSNSGASLAAAPIYNGHRIVQLSPQSSATSYSQAGPYSFRLVPPDDLQGEFIAQSLRDLDGVERIVVLYVNDDYGRSLRSSLLRGLAAGGPVVVGDAPHLEQSPNPEEEIDLARRIVAESRPDAVVWLGRPKTLGEYLPALDPLLEDAPIIGGDAIAVSDRYATQPLWRNVWYVDFVDLAGTPTILEFGRRYLELYGRPASGPDVLTYDATRLLLEAIRNGATTGPEVVAWLESLGRSRARHEGISGPIGFDADGNVDRSYTLSRVTVAHLPSEPEAP